MMKAIQTMNQTKRQIQSQYYQDQNLTILDKY